MDSTGPSGCHKPPPESPDLNTWLLARIRFWIVAGWLSAAESEPAS